MPSILIMAHCCHRGRGSVTSPGARGVLVPSDAGQLDERRHQPDVRALRRERGEEKTPRTGLELSHQMKGNVASLALRVPCCTPASLGEV